MRSFIALFLFFGTSLVLSQSNYDQASYYYNSGQLDSARFFIDRNLVKNPTSRDYFLSGMIHEAQGSDLRALADYEAVVKREGSNLEAYFQKGLIYYNTASYQPAINDFTYVINNQDGAETHAIYFSQDPNGVKGTFLSTIQTLLGRVHQYRGLAYQRIGEDDYALEDFNLALEYDSSAEVFINRALLFSRLGNNASAISDLKIAIELEPKNYLAWYNLAVLDIKSELPPELLEEEKFLPLLNLMGANAFESRNYEGSIQYYNKVLAENPTDDLALIGRGKALLKTEDYSEARSDFILAMQENSERVEILYLIGNSFFHEGNYDQALAFYNQYLAIDMQYASIWYNAAMANFSIEDVESGCLCLKKAKDLGMSTARKLFDEKCGSR